MTDPTLTPDTTTNATCAHSAMENYISDPNEENEAELRHFVGQMYERIAYVRMVCKGTKDTNGISLIVYKKLSGL